MVKCTIALQELDQCSINAIYRVEMSGKYRRLNNVKVSILRG